MTAAGLSRQVRFTQAASNLAVILLISILTSLSTASACSALPASGPSANGKRPQGSNEDEGKLHTLGLAREDAAYRYLAEKGAELFRVGRFGEAERYYRAALTNAENDGIQDRRLAMLVTNLATDLRQQQKYEESEALFERAVEIERRLKQKDEELMLYTAKQYAALLRETAREASGAEVIASAHNSFALAPKIKKGAASVDSAGESEYDSTASGRERQSPEKRLEQKSTDLFALKSELEPAPLAPLAPPAQLSVMAELKMLAEIEQGYMSSAMPESQFLPSSFSYLNSGPLYSSPGFSGIYVGGYGGSIGYGSFGGATGFGGGFHSHGGFHSSGRSGGGHR